MWEVFVWVPTRGWRRVLGTKNQRKAIETALSFVPLEVKLTRADGRVWYSGQGHMPMVGPAGQGLSQIEALNESLSVLPA